MTLVRWQNQAKTKDQDNSLNNRSFQPHAVIITLFILFPPDDSLMPYFINSLVALSISIYEGGAVSNVCATSFTHGSLAFP